MNEEATGNSTFVAKATSFLKNLPGVRMLRKLRGSFLKQMRLRENRRWLKEIKKLIRPVELHGGSMQRLGRQFDGGYLTVLPVFPVEVLLAYGISDDVSFELDFLKCFPIARAELFDHTVESLPEVHPRFTFHRQGVSAVSGGAFGSLSEHLRVYVRPEERVFVKMDVEGAEYESLLACSDDEFHRICGLVVELHSVHPDNAYALPLLQRLDRMFHLVHAHFNNSGGFASGAWGRFPGVVELSYVSRSGFSVAGFASLPHKLDSPCDPRCAEIEAAEFLS